MKDRAKPVLTDSSFMEIPLAFLSLINSSAKDFATVSAHLPTCMWQKLAEVIRENASTIENIFKQDVTPIPLTENLDRPYQTYPISQ